MGERERIEYPKKLSFATESDMDLFEGIIKAHRSDKNHKSDSDFLLYLLKEKYMPSDEMAFNFCKRLYSRNKDKDSEEIFTEKVFSVLEDVFVYLAGNCRSVPYSRNYALVYFVASITDNEILIPVQDTFLEEVEEYKPLKNALLTLCMDVMRKAQEDRKKLEVDVKDNSIYLRNLLKEMEFPASKLLEILVNEYPSFCDFVSYYNTLACLCKQISINPDVSEEDRYHLISIIRNMSRYWDAAKR